MKHPAAPQSLVETLDSDCGGSDNFWEFRIRELRSNAFGWVVFLALHHLSEGRCLSMPPDAIARRSREHSSVRWSVRADGGLRDMPALDR